jgi:hypothetical protein
MKNPIIMPRADTAPPLPPPGSTSAEDLRQYRLVQAKLRERDERARRRARGEDDDPLEGF